MKTNKLIKKFTAKTLLPIISTVVFSIQVFSTQAHGGWFDSKINKPFPTNSTELSGVFSGKQYIGGKSTFVQLFIHPGAMSGSFIITLLKTSSLDEARSAQIFYAEALEQKTLGLISLGLAKDRSSLEDKMPPAALLKIAVDNQNRIQTIELTSQDGVGFLEGPVTLSSVSDSYAISNTLPQGEYNDRYSDDNINIYSSGTEDILASGKIESLGISNDYSLSFDLTGVGALRSRAYADQFQKREKPDVSALVLPIIADNKPAVIVVKVSESGNQGPAVVLKLK